MLIPCNHDVAAIKSVIICSTSDMGDGSEPVLALDSATAAVNDINSPSLTWHGATARHGLSGRLSLFLRMKKYDKT